MITALIVGRFQPFHLGHLKNVEYVLDRVDEVIIVIGSSQKSYTQDNPFTAEERTEMIRNSVGDINRCTIVPVSDIHDNERWIKHVVVLTPKFDVVYTNSQLEKELFEKAGFRVNEVPFFEKEDYSATNIRGNIRNGREWEHLVPKGTSDVVRNIDGEKRIRESC